MLYGSLSEKEYREPVRVFSKAFKEYRPEELEDFLSDIVYFSLGTFHNVPERDIVGPYLHLMKMLDAAWLIAERKNRRKELLQYQSSKAEGKALTHKAHEIEEARVAHILEHMRENQRFSYRLSLLPVR